MLLLPLPLTMITNEHHGRREIPPCLYHAQKTSSYSDETRLRIDVDAHLSDSCRPEARSRASNMQWARAANPAFSGSKRTSRTVGAPESFGGPVTDNAPCLITHGRRHPPGFTHGCAYAPNGGNPSYDTFTRAIPSSHFNAVPHVNAGGADTAIPR